MLLTARMVWVVPQREGQERFCGSGSGRNANAFLDALGQLFSQHSNDADAIERGPAAVQYGRLN